jgi:DNA-binding XRE family transcriptional regulator
LLKTRSRLCVNVKNGYTKKLLAQKRALLNYLNGYREQLSMNSMSIFDKELRTFEVELNTSQFAVNLMNARKRKGLTQSEAAKALGKTRHSAITNWEKGTAVPRIQDLVSLCALYETTPNDILGF